MTGIYTRLGASLGRKQEADEYIGIYFDFEEYYLVVYQVLESNGKLSGTLEDQRELGKMTKMALLGQKEFRANGEGILVNWRLEIDL